MQFCFGLLIIILSLSNISIYLSLNSGSLSNKNKYSSKFIFLKNILIAILFLFINRLASATDYYVSNAGNDLDYGISASTSWKTITKVNTVFASLKPGDRILFKCGDTFYGTIKVAKSGISGNPITIGSYGSGEKPVITGFTTITGWTNEGNGIYSKVITSESQTNMVTIDGVNIAMGRYPKSTYATYESRTSNSITDIGLGSGTNWTGAEVVIRKNNFVLDRNKIISHSGDIITYSSLGSSTTGNPNYGYFFQNDLKCVTNYGDWYHDISTGKFYMYFGTVNPTTKIVKVATKNNLLYNYLSCKNLSINNLTLTGAITNIIDSYWGTDNFTIQNCNVSFCGYDGLRLEGSYQTINNNIVSDCGRNGIFCSGNNGNITNNKISNIGIIKGQSNNGTQVRAVHIGNSTYLVQNNNIANIGYVGIYLTQTANSITIKNNFINYVCLTLNDGGGIYLDRMHTSIIIDGNIILNSTGNVEGTNSSTLLADGIFLDELSSGITVKNNTLANCSESGIKLHKAHDNNITNNLSYNNGLGIYFLNSVTSISTYNNIVSGNILFAKGSAQYALKITSLVNDIPSFGTAGNNYYVRPINDNYVFRLYQPSIGWLDKSLSEWQSFTGQDANSHRSPISITNINDIRFEYNELNTNKIITLSQPMIDVTGMKYFTNVTLPPFTSMILMVDPNPTQPVIPLYTGSVVENATPDLLTVTFSLNLANIIPITSLFTVLVNSVARSISSITISGKNLQLKLGSPVSPGDIVTISYTKPSTNPLQTPSGGQANAIISQPVTNRVGSIVNIAPTIIITSPLSNTTFTDSTTITIVASALDSDGSISTVDFYNGNIKLGSKSQAPFIFAWNKVEEGTYSLTAIATDNLNVQTTSLDISISVISGTSSVNQSPIISITNPAKGQIYNHNSNITIDAIASDPDGIIRSVSFFNGTTKLVELSSMPYTYIWKDIEPGTYSITAVATDNFSATSISTPIDFIIEDSYIYDAGPENLKLYPNPNDGHFSVEFINQLLDEKGTIIISDSAGKRVYQGITSKEESVKQIDLYNSKPGIYILIIKDKNLFLSKKIIIN